MKKIKILHVLVSGSYSGAENVVCQIIDMFKDDNNIEMFYCSLDGPVRIALEEKGVNFHPVKELSIKELKRVIRDVQPTVVHAHDMRAGFLASLACGKIPLISHIHNNNYNSRSLSLKAILYLYAALKAKHIFWVSKTSYDGYYFHNRLLKKSEILYNVINIDNLINKAKQDTNTYDYDFAYLGRLTFQKNPQRLVRVMELACKMDSRLKFAILGKGELKDEILHYIEKHKLSENISFLGFNNNPYKLLQCCKGMLMTSRWEGLPMCALEAYSLGVPVVSTPADGLKELIESGNDGYLSDNDNELATQIVKIYQNREYHNKLSTAAYTKICKLMDLKNYKKSLFNVYNKYSM